MKVLHYRRTGKRTRSGSNIPQHDLTFFQEDGTKLIIKYTDSHSVEFLANRIATLFLAIPTKTYEPQAIDCLSQNQDCVVYYC